MAFVSDMRLLYLNFVEIPREKPVLWLLGMFLEFVEAEVVTHSRRITVTMLRGHLKYKRRESKWLAMPFLGYIPIIDDGG